jgi:hypothetical protein
MAAGASAVFTIRRHRVYSTSRKHNNIFQQQFINKHSVKV